MQKYMITSQMKYNILVVYHWHDEIVISFAFIRYKMLENARTLLNCIILKLKSYFETLLNQ